MIHSFRLRLALLSAVLSGLILIAFGVTAWSLIRDIRLERIDRDIRENAEREVRRERSFEDWRHIEAKLAASLGVRDESKFLLLVADADGKIVFCTRDCASFPMHEFPWPAPENKAPYERHQEPPPRAEPPRKERPPQASNFSRNIDDHLWHFGLASSSHARVAIGVDTSFVDVEMKGIRNAFVLALPLALVLVGLGAWLFSYRAMRPLQKLTAATHRISAEKLDQRIPLQGEDREFAELIAVFNSMLERLERSFMQAHRFSADAAHELKTPLAILQGQLERAMATVEAGSPIQAQLGGILDEVRRLSSISRKLLLLSQADSGRLNILREPFDLSAALSDLVEDIHLLAPDLKVTSQIQPGLLVQVDRTLFPQVLHNLISNAIKYNVEKGWIEISAARSAASVEVSIANSSSGMAPAEQTKVFERFFRADSAHGRQIDGVGLGLSVSREIARAHGGDISFAVDEDGVVRLGVTLPDLMR